jgi:hypothetical protein
MTHNLNYKIVLSARCKKKQKNKCVSAVSVGSTGERKLDIAEGYTARCNCLSGVGFTQIFSCSFISFLNHEPKPRFLDFFQVKTSQSVNTTKLA